jgi:hypothetical protein
MNSIVIDQDGKTVFSGTHQECFDFALKANLYLNAKLSVKRI